MLPLASPSLDALSYSEGTRCSAQHVRVDVAGAVWLPHKGPSHWGSSSSMSPLSDKESLRLWHLHRAEPLRDQVVLVPRHILVACELR